MFRPAKGSAIRHVKHAHRFTHQRLTLQHVGVVMHDIDDRCCNPLQLTLGETRGIHPAFQRGMGNGVVCEMCAPIGHRPSTSGSACSSARAPMPTPPLGRAGAFNGFQP